MISIDLHLITPTLSGLDGKYIYGSCYYSSNYFLLDYYLFLS